MYRWASLRRREDGFTLLELIIVVVVLAVLAAIAVPVFLNQVEKAQDAATQQEVSQVASIVNAGIGGNWLAGVDPDEGLGEYTQGDVPADATTGFATAADFQAGVPEGKVRIVSVAGAVIVDATMKVFASVGDAKWCLSKTSPTSRIYAATDEATGASRVNQVVRNCVPGDVAPNPGGGGGGTPGGGGGTPGPVPVIECDPNEEPCDSTPTPCVAGEGAFGEVINDPNACPPTDDPGPSDGTPVTPVQDPPPAVKEICETSDVLDAMADNGDELQRLQGWAEIHNLTGDVSSVFAARTVVGDYLDTLSRVQLRQPMSVMNYGWNSTTGEWFAFSTVLPKDDLILVDANGVVRGRCACGNPLTDADLTVPLNGDGEPLAWNPDTQTAEPIFGSSGPVTTGPNLTVSKTWISGGSYPGEWVVGLDNPEPATISVNSENTTMTWAVPENTSGSTNQTRIEEYCRSTALPLTGDHTANASRVSYQWLPYFNTASGSFSCAPGSYPYLYVRVPAAAAGVNSYQTLYNITVPE